MTSDRPIQACLVNHNTSDFAELAVRSLWTCNRDMAHRLALTVLDNHSDDDGLAALQQAVADLGASFEASRWPRQGSRVNSHGDVLRDFVLAQPEAEYLLFLDADIVFIEDDTVQTMLAELDSDPTLWAVQARFHWSEGAIGVGSSLDIGAGDPIDVAVRVGPTQHSYEFAAKGSVQSRLHPGCALIRNSPVFRQAAERPGLGCAVVLSGDGALAGYYDTMALASAAMAAAGFLYGLSAATVAHYFNVSYDRRDALTVAKREDCQRRLDVMRSDPTARPTPGPWG